MKLNHTAFIFIWLVGAGIVFYGIGTLELYLDYKRANSVYSNIFVLDSFKILLYIVTGIYSGTLFMTSKLTVHRALFLTIFILFLLLSFYPLLIFAVPLPMMDVIYPNYQKFAFIAGLSLFMTLYKFRTTPRLARTLQKPQMTGEQATDTKSGI